KERRKEGRSRRGRSDPMRSEISPSRIPAFNELDSLHPRPALDLFFSRNGLPLPDDLLVVDEPGNAILLGVSWVPLEKVFLQPSYNVVCYAYVQHARRVRQDVD